MFDSGIRIPRMLGHFFFWTFLCMQKKPSFEEREKNKSYNLHMEELDYKFQKQSSLSASSQNHFTSLSWN